MDGVYPVLTVEVDKDTVSEIIVILLSCSSNNPYLVVAQVKFLAAI